MQRIATHPVIDPTTDSVIHRITICFDSLRKLILCLKIGAIFSKLRRPSRSIPESGAGSSTLFMTFTISLALSNTTTLLTPPL